MIPTLASLLEDPRRALELSPESIPALLAQCAAVQAALAARLAAVPAPARNGGKDAPEGGRLLTVEEAAKIAGGLPPRWFSRHRGDLPFLRKVGKYLRVEESGFRRWLDSRKSS